MNFTEPFYTRPFVLVTPKRSGNNNNANRSGSRCNAVTAWVEVRNTSCDLCVSYGKRSGNGTDIPNPLESMNIIRHCVRNSVNQEFQCHINHISITDRLQRVKLSNACRSEWGSIPSGVPQGTKLGPWLFLLMINDLSPPSTLFDLWKYVDDTTVSEVVKKGQISFAQQAVDHISEWSGNNLFQLNREKTKELVISLSHASPQFPPVTMDGGLIEVTEKAKLLGVIINNSLTWNDHVEELVINAGRKLYFLTQLKRARVTSQDLVAFYCACARSSLDYACAVFHFSLPQYLQTELERIQKRALFTIYPGLSYAEALVEAGIESIQDHQRQLSINLFCAISENPDNKLNKLVPPIITSNYNLRKTRKFRVPVANTKRFAESFIMKGAQLA